MIDFRDNQSALDAKLAELGKKLQGDVIISGAAAAAREFYDEARARVPEQSGLLKSAIYRVLSVDNTDERKATYHISWNKRRAPHGHLVEYGTSRAPAHPFLRPAFDAARARAAEAAKRRMAERMRES